MPSTQLTLTVGSRAAATSSSQSTLRSASISAWQKKKRRRQGSTVECAKCGDHAHRPMPAAANYKSSGGLGRQGESGQHCRPQGCSMLGARCTHHYSDRPHASAARRRHSNSAGRPTWKSMPIFSPRFTIMARACEAQAAWEQFGRRAGLGNDLRVLLQMLVDVASSSCSGQVVAVRLLAALRSAMPQHGCPLLTFLAAKEKNGGNLKSASTSPTCSETSSFLNEVQPMKKRHAKRWRPA